MGTLIKPWGLFHRAKKDAPDRLFSKHATRLDADNAKWDQLGMGACAPGERFTIKRRVE